MLMTMIPIRDHHILSMEHLYPPCQVPRQALVLSEQTAPSSARNVVVGLDE